MSPSPVDRVRTPLLLAVLVVGCCAAAARPAVAEADRARHGIDLALAPSYSSVSTRGDGRDIDESSWGFETLGLRYHMRPTATWGFEVAVLTGDYFGSSADTYVDLSARRTLIETERFELFALGGAGVLFYDEATRRDETGFPDDDSRTTRETPTLHLGVGGIVDLTDRTYFRFDLKHHRFEELDIFGDYLIEDMDWNGSIGIGLRF